MMRRHAVAGAGRALRVRAFARQGLDPGLAVGVAAGEVVDQVERLGHHVVARHGLQRAAPRCRRGSGAARASRASAARRARAFSASRVSKIDRAAALHEVVEPADRGFAGHRPAGHDGPVDQRVERRARRARGRRRPVRPGRAPCGRTGRSRGPARPARLISSTAASPREHIGEAGRQRGVDLLRADRRGARPRRRSSPARAVGLGARGRRRERQRESRRRRARRGRPRRRGVAGSPAGRRARARRPCRRANRAAPARSARAAGRSARRAPAARCGRPERREVERAEHGVRRERVHGERSLRRP